MAWLLISNIQVDEGTPVFPAPNSFSAPNIWHAMEFEGKKILITAAGREFGRTLAISFAKLGAELFLSARTLEKARASKTVIKSISPAAVVHCFAADLTDGPQLKKFRTEVQSITDRIDVLIHNAAFWLERDLLDTDDEEIARAVATTATGPIIVTKQLLPLIKRSNAADIISNGQMWLSK